MCDIVHDLFIIYLQAAILMTYFPIGTITIHKDI